MADSRFARCNILFGLVAEERGPTVLRELTKAVVQFVGRLVRFGARLRFGWLAHSLLAHAPDDSNRRGVF